ncbi:ASCH domain-containing protein [Halorubrum sp. AJ67]|uniref:ASCH domain-containing protein n=1 Tax=Halorubrum sp. AJ67 TaxID=1173487 RepID=UPI0003DDDFE4|nr:ASCH domain-containing protein [Halorubrum sp. AJ67]CDK38031.1 hypothetical protein BN903_231 [Halorubrum sp. AJ67]
MSTKPSGPVGLKYGTGPQETARTAHEDKTLAATIRYDDEKEIGAGSDLVLQDANGEPFGTATVVHCEMLLTMCAFGPVRAYGAEYGLSTIPELLLTLNRYYNDTVTLETPVKVIIYEPHDITA